jgi:hypothetical protein
MSDPEPRAASTTTVPQGEPGDDTVASGKVPTARLPLDGHLRDDRAEFNHSRDQRHGFAGIGLGMPPGEHAERAGLETRGMHPLIDAAGEPRDDDVARPPESAREPVGESEPSRRSVA